MRRFTLALGLMAAFLFVTQSSFGQAQRKLVLVEIATGTWCTFCPGSALGADDLLDNGHPVAILEHHDGDSYETTESAARVAWYGVTGFPTTYMDGGNEIVGGNATTSIYEGYKPVAQAAYNVPTAFDIGMSWTQTGAQIDVAVDVEQMGAYSGAVNVYLVAIESHIAENWLGLTEVNEVNRDMVPTEMGTPLTITQGGGVVTTNLSFAIDPTWVQSNMDIVAFVQDPTTREVLNAIKTPLEIPANQFDQQLTAVYNVPTGISCSDTYAPEVSVQNNGSDEITSLTFDYEVTNGTMGSPYTGSFTWTGSLVVGVPVVATLPAINFTPDNNNMFNITISDAKDANNMTVVDAVAGDVSFSSPNAWEYSRDGGMYTFNITTDDYGYETYWEITSNGVVLASGGNTDVGAGGGGLQVATAGGTNAYANNTLFSTQVNLSAAADCFELNVIDDWGDGICCGVGNGAYELLDPYGNVVRAGGVFGAEELTNWFVTNVLSVEDRLDDEISVFPNPNNGQFTVKISDNLLGEGTISVLSMDGRIVYETALNGTEMDVTIKDMAAGTYLVKVNTAEKMGIKKMEIR